MVRQEVEEGCGRREGDGQAEDQEEAQMCCSPVAFPPTHVSSAQRNFRHQRNEDAEQ